MKRILIIGATSAIASATSRIWASEGEQFYLVGRNESRLSTIRDELQELGADQVTIHVTDLTDLSQHKNVITSAFAAFAPNIHICMSQCHLEHLLQTNI